MYGGKRSKPEDDIGMLEQLRAVDPFAASNFLEHLILQNRSDVRVSIVTYYGVLIPAF